MTISAADKLVCAERELKLRTRVYARWVDEGKMTKAQAKHEIACMAAIVQDYVVAAAKERLL